MFFILGKVPAPVPIRAEAELKIDGDIFTLDGMPVFLLGGSRPGKRFCNSGTRSMSITADTESSRMRFKSSAFPDTA